MPPSLKTIGPLDPELLNLLKRAKCNIKSFADPLEPTAEDIEGLDPVLLSDVGRYTARFLVKGLQRDIQATQRFFAQDLEQRSDDDLLAEQELRVLIDFTQAISRTLATAEIADAGVRFLQREVGVLGAAIHYWDGEHGLELARSVGFAPSQMAALQAYLTNVVDPGNITFRQGIQFGEGPGEDKPPIALNAVVPLLVKDTLMGSLSVLHNPHLHLSLDSLKAMGRQLALSLENGELLERSERTLQSLNLAQQSMSQAEKLAAVGMLAAGIAHEINNPTSFIITNLTMLGEYVDDLLVYVAELAKLYQSTAGADPQRLAALREVHDIEYLARDTPELIARSVKGMHRIRDIVRDLKTFAHKGTGDPEWVEVNQLVAQVIKLAGAELRHRARLELDLRPIPQLRLESTRLIQVLLNLIINAYQSFGDRPRSKNAVWVGSLWENNAVSIFVTDNGSGIPADQLDRIFEPFYTTKPVGTGTGLGLAISYDLVKTMRGQIHVESTPGRGTRFTVELPLRSAKNEDGLEWRPQSNTSLDVDGEAK